jgi:hypothetical protein
VLVLVIVASREVLNAALEQRAKHRQVMERLQ